MRSSSRTIERWPDERLEAEIESVRSRRSHNILDIVYYALLLDEQAERADNRAGNN